MRAEYTPSIETIGRPTTVLGGESRMQVSWTRVLALCPGVTLALSGFHLRNISSADFQVSGTPERMIRKKLISHCTNRKFRVSGGGGGGRRKGYPE